MGIVTVGINRDFNSGLTGVVRRSATVRAAITSFYQMILLGCLRNLHQRLDSLALGQSVSQRLSLAVANIPILCFQRVKDIIDIMSVWVARLPERPLQLLTG
jgi:hypothetical protein